MEFACLFMELIFPSVNVFATYSSAFLNGILFEIFFYVNKIISELVYQIGKASYHVESYFTSIFGVFLLKLTVIFSLAFY